MSNYTQEEQQLSGLSELEWSPASFKVDDFLKKFSLPQIVKVNEGFYGDDEASSLGADQVLTLHLVKSTDKVFGHDYRGKEIHIPLNCPRKIEVRPSNFKDVYETVDELLAVMPNYVRISQGYYSISRDEEILNVGDKLRLKTVEKNKKGVAERLVCVNQNGTTIELPRDCSAGFQPLVDGKEYYLAEVAKHFTLPLYVQFVDPPVVGGARGLRRNDEAVFNSSLGTIYLQKKYQENLVIASTLSHDGQRTVVTFPRDMDIRVSACENMLRNCSSYAQICQMIHDGVDLTTFRHIDAYSVFRPRNSVKEFAYKELVSIAGATSDGVSSDDVNKIELIPRKRSESAKLKQESVPMAPQDLQRQSPEVTRASPEVRSSPKVARSSPEVRRSSPEVNQLSPDDEQKQPEGENGSLEVTSSSAKIKQEPEVVESKVGDSIPQEISVINKGDEKIQRSGSLGTSGKPPCPPKPLRKRSSLPKDVKVTGGNQACPREELLETTPTGKETADPEPQGTQAMLSENGSFSCDEQKRESRPSSNTSKRNAPDISSCSVKQVSDILRELGMSKHVVKFEAEMIDGEMLSCLTDDILMVDFGMTKLHCMKLKKYLQGWRPKV